MPTPQGRLEKITIAIISAAFVIWSAALIYHSSFVAIDGRRYFCLFDDAMISMRYAWNLSHGIGLVWNPGERVEGYSNLLMTLIMSLATLVFDKSTAALSIQILGAGLMLIIAYLAMRIADHITRNETQAHQRLVRVLAFVGTLAYYPLVYWSLMGMETGLLAALVLAAVFWSLRFAETGRPDLLGLVSACLGLAYLTRNDSAIFSILVWLYVAWESRRFPDIRPAQVLKSIGLFLLFVAGQAAFRYSYYGEVLPNTYTLKLTGMPLAARIANGVGFIRPFLFEAAVVFAISAACLVFRFRPDKFLMFAMAGSAVVYQVYAGGDPWPYWRIMAPTMPLVLLLFSDTITALALHASSRMAPGSEGMRASLLRGGRPAYVMAAVLVLLGLIPLDLKFYPEMLLSVKPYSAYANERNVNIAIALERVTGEDASVGVFFAGAIPYFTDRRAVDFLGKSDRYVAHLPPDLFSKVPVNGMTSLPGHNKYDLNYSIRLLEPTYVQGLKWGRQNLTKWARSTYVKVEYEGIELILLKDSPDVLWREIYGP